MNLGQTEIIIQLEILVLIQLINFVYKKKKTIRKWKYITVVERVYSGNCLSVSHFKLCHLLTWKFK